MKTTRRKRRSPWPLVHAIAMASAVGCGFATLRKDIEHARKNLPEPAAVQGSVSAEGTGGGPFVVVVHDVSAGRTTNLLVLPRPGRFAFTLPAGTYRLAAFEDVDRDLRHRPGVERATVLEDPGVLELEPGERRTGLELAFGAVAATQIPFDVAPPVSPADEGAVLFDLQLGTVVTLDDPRFSDENGELGLWRPLDFLANVGAGVYFLEPYDPDKVPVLFVHGAGGHPGNWRFLIERLDRSRFQPWLAYYPSAPDLDRVGRALVRAIGAAATTLGFSRLAVVAHSMGGLVARSAINAAVEPAEPTHAVAVPAFVTLASPWEGHPGAAIGVKYAPVVAPSWGDMAPGSTFLAALPGTPLPAECEYSLFFAYRSSGRGREANDGVVSVASQLSLPIQTQATRVLGFDETHTSVLESAVVAEQLDAVLRRAIAGSSPPPTRGSPSS